MTSALFSMSRLTHASRRGKGMPQAPPTIAAKRCPSSPAHSAKTSTFSPSTSPSIDIQKRTLSEQKHKSVFIWSLSVKTKRTACYCLTLSHSPLLQPYICFRLHLTHMCKGTCFRQEKENPMLFQVHTLWWETKMCVCLCQLNGLFFC